MPLINFKWDEARVVTKDGKQGLSVDAENYQTGKVVSVFVDSDAIKGGPHGERGWAEILRRHPVVS